MKTRIAWFTPTEEIKDFSVAKYTSELLLPNIAKHFDVTVFSNSFNDTYLGLKQVHYLRAKELHKENPYDIFFYNFEDKPHSNFIRIHLGLIPGIVWFHNFTFTTFGPEPILNSNWKNIIEKFKQRDIPWTSRDKTIEQEGKLGFREGGLSLKAFFSNPSYAYQYNACKVRISDDKGIYLPLPVDANDIEVKKDKKFSIAVSGLASTENRVHKLITALRNLDFDFRVVWLTEESSKEKVGSLLEDFSDTEILTDYNLSTWREVLAKTDIALHLLFSAYNQVGPFMYQSMVAGKPVICTSFGGSDLISDDLIFKIEPGMYEAREIEHVIKAIYEGRVKFDSKKLAELAKANYSTEMVSGELINFLSDFKKESKIFLSTWNEFMSDSKSDLKDEIYGFHKGNTFELEKIFLANNLKGLF